MFFKQLSRIRKKNLIYKKEIITCSNDNKRLKAYCE